MLWQNTYQHVVYKKYHIQYIPSSCGTPYLHHLWLGFSMLLLKEEKKNRSAYCATIWQRARCVSGHTSKCVQKHVQRQNFAMLASVHVHRCFCVRLRRICFPRRNTFKHVLEDWKRLQIGARLSESNLASLCTKHVFQEKEKKILETSNRKVRIYERRKMCGCKVNPALNRRKTMYWS